MKCRLATALSIAALVVVAPVALADGPPADAPGGPPASPPAAPPSSAPQPPQATSSCVVPWVRGRRLRAARALLLEQGCRVSVRLVRSRRARRGFVVSQSYAGGTRLPVGTFVVLRAGREPARS